MLGNTITEEYTLELKYRICINVDTGELVEHKLISRKVDKANFEIIEDKPKKVSKKIVEGKEPQLILEDNKFILNTAAVELLEVTVGDKIDIKYEQTNGKFRPIIGKDEVFGTQGGTKLTKTFTCSYRGVKNEELAKYGKEFNIIKHPDKVGVFLLTGDSQIEEIEIAEEDLDLPLNVDDLAIEPDTEITEITSDFFTFD